MNIKKQTNKDDGCGNNMEKFLRTGIRLKQNQNDKRETGRSRSESKEEYYSIMRKREKLVFFFIEN